MDPVAETDTAAAIAQLADAAAHACTVLFNYRRDHPDAPDAAQALALERALDLRAIELRTQAIRMLGDQAAPAVAGLQAAAQRVASFFDGIGRDQAGLALADAILALAAATLASDPGGVLSAIVGVQSALSDAQAASRSIASAPQAPAA